MNPTNTAQATMEKVRYYKKEHILLSKRYDDGGEKPKADWFNWHNQLGVDFQEISSYIEVLYKDLQIAREALEKAREFLIKENTVGFENDAEQQEERTKIIISLSTYQQGR